MGKRIISFILIAVMTFGICSAVSADTSELAQRVIDKLLGFSAEERKNLITLARPMFTSDSGIDVIISMINDYNPNSNSPFDDFIGSLLKYTDKKKAISAVSSLKIIDEDLRRQYANYFESRESLKLSDAALQDIKYFITKACNKYSRLDKLISEDGITEDVVARLLKVFTDINFGLPLLTDDNTNNKVFEIYAVSNELKDKIKQYISNNGFGSYNELSDAYLKRFNALFTDEEKDKIKKIGKEIGFYTPSIKAVSSSSGTAFQKESTEIKYNVISDNSVLSGIDLYGSTVIEVALYKNGVKQDSAAFDKDYTIAIPVESENAMAYTVEDSLVPVMYSAYSDKNLYLRISQTGYYAIKVMPKYFTDSNDWGSFYIEALYNRGVINGVSDNRFAPDINVTREEFVKLIVSMFNYNDDTYYAGFTDVSSDDWYYKYVAIAYKYGIVNGVGDARFGTGEYITRQDMCKIISNIIKQNNIAVNYMSEDKYFADSDKISEYAKESVSLMAKSGIINGDQNEFFNPKSFATRQETAKIIFGILKLYVVETLY